MPATLEPAKSGALPRPRTPAKVPEAATPGTGRKTPPWVPTAGQRLRATMVLGGVIVGLTALSGRLYELQVRDHDHYGNLARKQQQRVRAILPWRGDLLAQEDGRPVVVAASLQRGSLLVEGRPSIDEDPEKGRDNDLFLERLDAAVTLTQEEKASVADKLARGRAFFFRRRKLAPEDMERLHGARLAAAQVVEEPVRAYPFGPLGIQVMGLVSADGEGVSGIEKAYDEQLEGVRGLREVELDNRHRELISEGSVAVEPRPGLSVLLTLDRRIQAIAEEEADTLCEKWSPKGVSIVVVEPRTGNVLAAVTRPTFTPDNLANAPFEAYKLRGLSDTYEPGSTIKALVVGTAWDLGLGNPENAINCPKVWHLPGRKKAIEDVHDVGMTTEAGVLVQSSNPGSVQIGARVGMPRLKESFEAFGLGRPTGIQLPGEIGGNTKCLSKNDPTTLGSICQGYALTVTPMQMALAYAAIANGGTLYRPRIVSELRNAQGETVRRFEPSPAARVLSTKVAKEWLAPALERVVSDPHGTAHACKVPGYQLAGKTGTTKKIVNGHYSEREAITSFCGFAPYDDARIAISVVVFEPSTAKGKVWGGTVAAPCASAIVGKTLKYLGVPETHLPEAEEPAKHH